MARIVELSSGLGYGAAEDRRNHKQFLEMIYKIKFDPKMETFTTPNAACSTNSIVAKALNAVMRNYDVKPGWTNRWSGELKPGTKVTVVDSPMRYGGMAGEVVRRDGSRYVVRLDDIAGMEVQLNPNQISVKNAATGTVTEKAVNAKDAEGNLIKVGDTVILSDEGDYENPKEFKVTSISGKYVHLDDGHHEYEKDLLVYNSRARNAAGYVDASSVVLYPGDAVVFKAQYSSHKDDDEWLERNGDTVIEVRGNEVKIGPSANDWAKKSDLMVWHNAACSRNDVLGRYKPGARVAVELRTRPIIGKVVEFGGRPEVEYSPTTRTRFTGTLIKQNGDKWDIKSDSGEVYKSVSEADFGLSYNARSRNAVVAKALNARARNDEQFHTYLVPVLRKGVKDYVTIERVADEETAKELVDVPSFRIIGVTVDETRPVKKAMNAATARNADDPHDIDAHGKKLVKGDWVRFLMDLPDVKKGECALVKYALPGGLIFSTLAGAREISWDASVVEKMPPIPRSLSQIDAWKKGPRA
jgi:uncharacterized Zn ribbon protein